MTTQVWTEHYRPFLLNDVQGHSSNKCLLQVYSKKIHLLPNLLMYGPSGTGKSSACMAFIRQCLWNHENSKMQDVDQCNNQDKKDWTARVNRVNQNVSCLVHKINASLDRGIDTIREDIMQVIENQSIQAQTFPYKFIILEECDKLTKHAQLALRRVTEENMRHVRFILICNDESKLIPALVSRCKSLYFGRLSISEVKETLKRIAEDQQVDLSKSVLESMEAIAKRNNGDARSSIQELQSWSKSASSNDCFKEIEQKVEFWFQKCTGFGFDIGGTSSVDNPTLDMDQVTNQANLFFKDVSDTGGDQEYWILQWYEKCLALFHRREFSSESLRNMLHMLNRSYQASIVTENYHLQLSCWNLFLQCSRHPLKKINVSSSMSM